MTLIIERRLVLAPLAFAVVLTTMPAFAQEIAQSTVPATVGQSEQLPPGFTEKSVMVNGVRINYKIGGQGPAVVLLHGYAETSHMWLPLMPQLAASHTVIVPDLRGPGTRSARRVATIRRPWRKTFTNLCSSSALSR